MSSHITMSSEMQSSQSFLEEENNENIHTYTPKSHEELLKRFTEYMSRKDNVKTLQRENDYLKRELSDHQKQLKELQMRLMQLESAKNKTANTNNSSSEPLVESQRADLSKLLNADCSNDAEFAQSWRILGHHFNEVIRRHHEVLAEKERLIKELQEKKNINEIPEYLVNPPASTSTPRNPENLTNKSLYTTQDSKISNRRQNTTTNQNIVNSKTKSECIEDKRKILIQDDKDQNLNLNLSFFDSKILKEDRKFLAQDEESEDRSKNLGFVDSKILKDGKSNLTAQDNSQILSINPSISDSKIIKGVKSKHLTRYDESYRGEYQVANEPMNNETMLLDDCLDSGEILRQHFNEVIRRHKKELEEKDGLIKELQEALECCHKRKGTSDKQDWAQEFQIKAPEFYDGKSGQNTVLNNKSPTGYSSEDDQYTDFPTKLTIRLPSIDEDGEGYDKTGSTDTFVALERCQRYEAITNLDKMRRTFMKRLECEEKLDKLYWQTELRRHQTYKEQAGDYSDPECTLTKDFEAFEGTRIELIKALNTLKSTADHTNCPQCLKCPQSPSVDSEGRRCMTLEEQVVFTTLQTLYDT